MTGSLPSGASRLAVPFRELTGAVEAGLAAHPGSAQERGVWLLDALAAGFGRDGVDVVLDELTLAEFDGCLADLFAGLYGGQLPCESRCASCGERFEFTLSLEAFRARVAAEGAGYSVAEGVALAPSGRRFRLPRLGDLGRLRAEGPEAWLRSLLVEGPFEAETLEAEIAAASPVLSQDLMAACPSCGATNNARFDMAQYLVDTLAGEADFLWREVHLIARSYGWGLTDILSLPRGVRRQLAGLVVAETQPRLRAAS